MKGTYYALLMMLGLMSAVLAPLVFDVERVRAEGGIIYIRSDGSIDPAAQLIMRNGDYYMLTGDVTTGGIVIERDNMTLDGATHRLQGGQENETGINLSSRNNVTIGNLTISFFIKGIFLNASDYNNVSGNNITANWSLELFDSNYNSISRAR